MPILAHKMQLYICMNNMKKENKMKQIKTIKALKKNIEQSENAIYVRWSRGPAKDKKRGYSRDYVTGNNHNGLSSVLIEKEWLSDDKWLARRITEYNFLRLNDNKIACWIYEGKRVGTDSDGYDLIIDINCIAKINNNLSEQMIELKNN